jgi:hypothetical protein
MGGVRRSGRIRKEVGILLLGTDNSGRVFSEETVTVVLSLHGAGILSRYKLAADEILTLRLLGANQQAEVRLVDTSQEAEVRLVGQMGEEARGYTYGVAFVDPDLDFWRIDFPPPTRYDDAKLTLECCLCRSRQVVEQSEIEADVYAIAQSILLHCQSCGIATAWRKASSEPASKKAIPPLEDRGKQGLKPMESTPSMSELKLRPPAPLVAPLADRGKQGEPFPQGELKLRPPAPSASPGGAKVESSGSAYAGSRIDICSSSESAPSVEKTTELPVQTTVQAPLRASAPVHSVVQAPVHAWVRAPGQTSVPVPVKVAAPASVSSKVPPAKILPAELRAPWERGSDNRRRDVRTRVSFTACIRQGESSDEIVECDNISKGGLSFRSRKSYAVDSVIEVAAPYSPGWQAIFILARIKHFEPLPSGTLFRYGAVYVPKTPGNSQRKG